MRDHCLQISNLVLFVLDHAHVEVLTVGVKIVYYALDWGLVAELSSPLVQMAGLSRKQLEVPANLIQVYRFYFPWVAV